METKAAIIKRLTEAIDQHSTSAQDVTHLVNFILDAGEFLTELRGQADNGTMRSALSIQKLILEHGKDLEAPFTVLADTANSAAILAGQHAEGLNLINSMFDDLEQVVDEFNA